jgi:hypothetical protein
MSERGSPPSDQGGDRRVGDALADSDLDHQIDPDLMARLAAWFDPAQLRPPSESERKQRAAAERQARTAAAVDPALQRRLERKAERGATVVRPLPPLHLRVDPTISRFDVDAWRLPPSGELREVERPDFIPDLMQENTPQAVLRDLHRPVLPPPAHVMYEQTLLATTIGSVHDLVRETMQATLVADMTSDLSPRWVLREENRALRAILDAPWEESKPEKPSALPSSVPSAENLYWFGQHAEE